MDWHKGSALQWILGPASGGNHAKVLAIYLGDDTTDEDAFAALPEGVTVRVGLTREEHTRARYYVRSTEEARGLLQHL